MTPASDNQIKFSVNVPVQFCPKWTAGKAVQSQYGDRFMFTAVDGRKAFVSGDEATALEEAMRRYQIRPGEDFVRVTKMQHGRSSFLKVEPVGDADDRENDERGTLSVPKLPERTRTTPANTYPSSLEAKLTQSVELARTVGPAAFISQPTQPERPPIDHLTARLTASFVSAIEAIVDAQRYARGRQLEVTFTSEDIRATAISAFIQGEKLLLDRGGR